VWTLKHCYNFTNIFSLNTFFYKKLFLFVSSEGHWSEVVDDHETKTVSTIDTIDSNKTQLNHKTAATAWRKRLLPPNFSVSTWNGVFKKTQFQIVQTQLYFWKLCNLLRILRRLIWCPGDKFSYFLEKWNNEWNQWSECVGPV